MSEVALMKVGVRGVTQAFLREVVAMMQAYGQRVDIVDTFTMYRQAGVTHELEERLNRLGVDPRKLVGRGTVQLTAPLCVQARYGSTAGLFVRDGSLYVVTDSDYQKHWEQRLTQWMTACRARKALMTAYGRKVRVEVQGDRVAVSV